MEEVYLGMNLNWAIKRPVDVDQGVILVLDGREAGNPVARRRVPPGTYRVTRKDGEAPGYVGYYGYPVNDAD